LIAGGKGNQAMTIVAFQTRSEPLRFRAEPAWREQTKRAMDIAVSVIALIVLSPLLFLIATAIRIDSGTPAIYRQTRHGLHRRPFTIYKFRTLYVADDDNVFRQVQNPDDGVTRLGHFLRASNLDELPQLWNVFRGDMSLVGPRPHPVAMDERYERLLPAYLRRYAAKPGLTGWAQVNGHRGPTPTLEMVEDRIKHDLFYLKNRSLLLDLKIMAMTVFSATAFHNAF
jgi:lipopolysaccharide/colanic/teichoic acid biosynthesis glycosyltransferase